MNPISDLGITCILTSLMRLQLYFSGQNDAEIVIQVHMALQYIQFNCFISQVNNSLFISIQMPSATSEHVNCNKFKIEYHFYNLCLFNSFSHFYTLINKTQRHHSHPHSHIYLLQCYLYNFIQSFRALLLYFNVNIYWFITYLTNL